VLNPDQGKAFAEFVTGTVSAKEALIEQEFMGGKAGELWLAQQFGFDFVEFLPLSLAARQRDVRLVGARLGNKAAGLGCFADALLEQKQLWGEPDANYENSGAIKAVQSLKADADRWRMNRVQTLHDAGKSLFAGIA
jgi:hypothetical protein